MNHRIVVLDGHALNPGDLDWSPLRALAPAEIHERTPEPLVAERASAATIVLTNKSLLRAETIATLPALQCISVLATGFNIVDTAAAAARGIPVCNVPAYGTFSVAQHTFALILELCHRVWDHAADVARGGWTRNPDWSYALAPLTELADKTLGLVGYGRIARQAARIGLAFGMRVIAHTPSRTAGADGGVRFAPLEDLVREADFLSLHCPLTAANSGLLNAERLRAMKPSAYVINTARGPLIDEAALAAALRDGVIAGAALDVLSQEPPPADHPLLGAPRCLITPHNAWATREARARLLAVTVENVRAFLAGAPVNVVNGVRSS
jgi:glycerate dehydrogenase